MLAVATGDVIAVDPPERTFLLVGYIGSGRSELVQPHIAGLVDDLSAGCVAYRTKVFGDRRLPIGHHLLAGKFFGVNEEKPSALPCNGRAVMGMPLAIHSLAQSDLPQQRDGAGLQHPGANSLQHMAAALSFQENAVDAVAVKNMGQEQTGRAAAYDRHLGSPRRRCHCRLSKQGCWLSKGSTAEIRKSILHCVRSGSVAPDTLVWDLARIAGLAEDTGATRPAGRRRGLSVCGTKQRFVATHRLGRYWRHSGYAIRIA